MSKIRVITKKEYIVEWDDGRKIDLSCGDVVKVYFVDGTYLEGIVGLPERMEPFTLAIKTQTGFITVRWTLIERIIITGHEADDSLYFYSNWVELAYDK